MSSVNLTKKIEGGRYCPVVIADNGRIKPDWVIVSGNQERHTEGSYYIDWTESGKRRRRMVGKSASSALAQKLRKEAELEAAARGVQIITEDGTKRRRIADASATYLEEVQLTKKHKTWLAYSTAVVYFMESCKKTYMDEIDRSDLLHYTVFLRNKKHQSPRSIANKFENVVTFLKAHDIKGIIRKGDWPTYVQTEPEIYEAADLKTFFAACDEKERLIFRFFLMTGMREQEVMYTMQRNVHTAHFTVSMTWKPEFNWSPKGYKEREIPVPSVLTDEIVAGRPEGWKGNNLLFPTSNGKANHKLLAICKAVADRAGLDPAEWWLHKFRATFATLHLQNGVDLRTVQKWMGHTDLESTMRYLKPARSEQVRDRVNSTFV